MILNFQKSLIILGCSLFYDEFFQCAKYHLYFICLMFFLYLMIFVSQLKPRPDLSGALFAQRSEAKKRERRAEPVAQNHTFTFKRSTCRILYTISRSNSLSSIFTAPKPLFFRSISRSMEMILVQCLRL